MIPDRWLLEALLGKLESDGRADAVADLKARIAAAIHPTGTGARLSAESAAALASEMLGGAGPVLRPGDRISLGPTRAHRPISVHITSAALVTIELWMPFATMPCGSWSVRGPGSTRIDLVPNETLAPKDLVGPDDFGAVVAVGRDGDLPTWVTFAP